MSKSKVRIVEVGPRDGLQNEKIILSLAQKFELIQALQNANIKNIEIASFVSPQWVPQMQESKEIVQKVLKQKNASKFMYSALVPNEKGMHDAIASGISEIAIFASATESFSKKNINCSIEESFARFAPVVALAKKHKIKIRAYLSVCFVCPYEGKTPEKKVIQLTKKLLDLGAYEVSIGDTIGHANPKHVKSLVSKLVKNFGAKKIAMHFHDTRGMALANILQSLSLGIRSFDASVGGLGGCPYAKGASGNVATEDVVHMLHEMGFDTGIHLANLLQATAWIEGIMSRKMLSKLSKSY